jgi:DNA polymerase II small subunit/DNA polymerase delta subunit B
MLQEFNKIHQLPNPAFFSLNEIKIASINANTIKDICANFITKDMDISNIDVALTSIIEQRNLYPLYPPFYNGL